TGTQPTLAGFTIDGSLVPAATAHGIYANGSIRKAILRDVGVSGAGINTGVYCSSASSSLIPTTWRVTNVLVSNNTGTGFFLSSATDGDWTDCEAIGCGADAWNISGTSNTKLTGCRAEWSQ